MTIDVISDQQGSRLEMENIVRLRKGLYIGMRHTADFLVAFFPCGFLTRGGTIPRAMALAAACNVTEKTCHH